MAKGKEKLYCVTFNWYGEIHKIHTFAVSEPKARENAIITLAKKLRRSRPYVRAYFDTKTDRIGTRIVEE